VIAEPVTLEGQDVVVTATIGISINHHGSEDSGNLLKYADIAMYDARKDRKNNYRFFDHSMNADAVERLDMENKLRKAYNNEEFTLFYQPFVDINTGRITGMEALLRWQHPEKGIVAPTEFIPLAEETGLIIPLSKWVLHRACLQNKLWQEAGFSPVKISVNMSAQQFRGHDLAGTIARVLEDTGMSGEHLVLELTENILMQNTEQTILVLKELSSMGLGLAMDDFGTGYSSLNYLKRFPLGIMKIDRSFIKDIINGKEEAAIVKAIIAMAQSLKLKVIAEGVETEEQLQFLAGYGCNEVQGYLFSVPLPAEDVPGLLAREREENGIGRRVLHKTVKTIKKS
jgi:EAL domain-containing protein (putative c-di-GMP-specific phosphodiesterase class I)